MYSHTFLVTSVRGIGLAPITAASAALGVMAFMKAALGVRFLAAGAFAGAAFLAGAAAFAGAAFLAGAFVAGAFFAVAMLTFLFVGLGALPARQRHPWLADRDATG